MTESFVEKTKATFEWAEHIHFLVILLVAIGAKNLLSYLFTRYSTLPSDLRGAVCWLLAALLLLFLSLIMHAVAETRANKTPPTPIARTKVSERWLYTPLKQIYRTNFQDQDVRLDGYVFIDCTFGSGVKLFFSGTAPFRIEPFTRTPDFKWAFETDNLAIP